VNCNKVPLIREVTLKGSKRTLKVRKSPKEHALNPD